MWELSAIAGMMLTQGPINCGKLLLLTHTNSTLLPTDGLGPARATCPLTLLTCNDKGAPSGWDFFFFFTVFHPPTALGYPFVKERSHREQTSLLPAQLCSWLLQEAKYSTNMEAGRRSVLAVPKLGTPYWRDDRKPEQRDLPSLPQAANSIQAVPHIIQYQAINQRKT